MMISGLKKPTEVLKYVSNINKKLSIKGSSRLD